ncbi:TPA: hypothetical protein U5E40_003322 [Yersinia enterocolitica]|nr:hypothetical protein [Yersinia enterocolitica]
MRFIAMILNNAYYINIAVTLLFMLVFIACFVRFIYKELGGVKIGKDSFLFFDFMLFCSGWKSDIPALAMVLTLFFGNFIDYTRNYNTDIIHVNIIGFFAMLLLFVHCRFFSGVVYDGKRVKFIKEFFLNFKPLPKNIFLWLSRVLYITFIVCIYRS